MLKDRGSATLRRAMSARSRRTRIVRPPAPASRIVHPYVFQSFPPNESVSTPRTARTIPLALRVPAAGTEVRYSHVEMMRRRPDRGGDRPPAAQILRRGVVIRCVHAVSCGLSLSGHSGHLSSDHLANRPVKAAAVARVRLECRARRHVVVSLGRAVTFASADVTPARSHSKWVRPLDAVLTTTMHERTSDRSARDGSACTWPGARGVAAASISARLGVLGVFGVERLAEDRAVESPWP